MKNYFCTNCGQKQTKENKVCPYCMKKIKTKNTPVKNLMYEYIEDKIKGNVKDTFFSVLINFIKSHLYGTILTMTIVATITANVVSNKISEPKIAFEKPKVMSAAKYTDGASLMEDFVNALTSGDEKKLSTMLYQNVNPEKYHEYFSEKEHYITGSIDGNIKKSYNILDYANELKNLKPYYAIEYHDFYTTTAIDALNHGHFDERYFEETKILAESGIDTVEGYISLNYCKDPNTCKETYDYDFYLSTFYLLIKVDGNWYVYKTLSTESEFEFLIKYKGNFNEIIKEYK